MTLRFLIGVHLIGVSLLVFGCSSTPQEPKSIPLPSSTRRVLKVCAAKNKLNRVDLVSLARRYGVMNGAEPSIGEILKLNEKCRTAPDAENLDLTLPQCVNEKLDHCTTGIVLVPIQ